MTEKDLDIAIEKCERILECDTRTLKNPESENGYIFDKVYELLEFLRQFEFNNGEDAVPVRRGRWIVGKNLFRQCNRCGYERKDDNPKWDTNFCPNCGADMREDGKGWERQ